MNKKMTKSKLADKFYCEIFEGMPALNSYGKLARYPQSLGQGIIYYQLIPIQPKQTDKAYEALSVKTIMEDFVLFETEEQAKEYYDTFTEEVNYVV